MSDEPETKNAGTENEGGAIPVETVPIPPPPPPSGAAPDGLFWGMKENTFAMTMNLALFAGMIVPGAGLVLPVVMWITNKDRSALIDRWGKNILNFILSLLIYGAVSVLLCWILIGFVLLTVLSIIWIVYPIVGALKANDGLYWRFPLCFRFFDDGEA